MSEESTGGYTIKTDAKKMGDGKEQNVADTEGSDHNPDNERDIGSAGEHCDAHFKYEQRCERQPYGKLKTGSPSYGNCL